MVSVRSESFVQQIRNGCSHVAAGSICVIISRKESVTNLTGTLSFSSSRGDVGVGGEINKTMKSYKMGHGYRR